MSHQTTARLARATPRAILLDALVRATTTGACDEVVTRSCAHASEVARLAAEIAPLAGVDPIDASSAGLLHDVGELLLLAAHPDTYGALLARPLTHGAQLDGEKDAFGADHALRGAEHLLDHRVAHVVADAVADHHDPFRGSDPTTLVVAAADEIASEDPDRRHACELLGVSTADAAAMLAAVRYTDARADSLRP